MPTPPASSVRVRFAPSPTGRLHIGNLRPALLSWLFARRNGGHFLLRIDDTDRARSSRELEEAIVADLSWLGFDWDAFARQSDRFDRYAAAVASLRASGRLYACYESEDELDRKRKRQHARGAPPVYDRAGLRLSAAERDALEQAGRRPYWRFLLANHGGDPHAPRRTDIAWGDLIRGEQSVDIASLSDPVLVREDGAYLYTLASVVDDIDHDITHVIRGEDHVTNTGVQIDIFRALGAEPPAFAHHSLLVGADGEALSKRLGSLSLASFRERGLEPMAVTSYVAGLGTSEPMAPATSMAELASRFDLGRLSRAPARFDEKELEALNARLLHLLPFASVADRLAIEGLPDPEAFWLAVRGNLAVLADAETWRQVVLGPMAPVIENAELCAKAAGLLPPEPWSAATWPEWSAEVGKAAAVKGRALFHPLRLALTGRESGPEMKALLPLIGRERALARLGGDSFSSSRAGEG